MMKLMKQVAWLVPGLIVASYLGCNSNPGSLDTAADRKLPLIANAKSMSRHYVEVTFAGEVSAVAADASRYVVTDPKSERLPVTRVELTGDPTRVLLVTDSQEPVNYDLRVDRTDVPAVDGLEAQANPEIAFVGDNGVEPCILYAIALNNTQVLITFDLAMDPAATQDKKYYEFQPDLGISSVVLDPVARKTAVLTTDPQQNIDYTLRVTNVKSGASNYYLIDPVCNEATFNGIPPVDAAAPRLVDAQPTSSGTILLRFNEPVNGAAGDPSNYSISPSLLVVSATPNSFGNLVTLQTLPMQLGIAYTVVVSNVRDLASPLSNLIDAAFNSKSFTFAGQLSLGGSDDKPRVVGAISTGNTGVRIAFNRVMGDGLENPLHYEISGSDSAYVRVMSVKANADRTWVDLETISQNADLYTVHVVNVKDSAGNALAALDGLLAPPFGFDPTRATFRGTPPVIDFETGKMYGTDDATDKLIVINTDTGAATAVGALGFADVQGIAFDPNTDTLYGVNSTTAQLIRINTATGAGTAIGALGLTDVRGLVFDPNHNKLYGTDNTTDRLIVINTTTGAGTAVGALGFSDVRGLAFDPNTDTLYGADANTDKLITINPATGVGIMVGALGFTEIRGIAFDSHTDTLYGADDSTDKLITINPATGAGTAVGSFGFTGVRGLAFDPPLNQQVDTDGDGFADWFEQLGWFVTVQFDDGTIRTAHVTSDPFSKDTDGDGIYDGDENRHNFDPRTDDTDADQVTDGDEFNVWYSDPRKQDSDDDGISDLLEIEFFRTSSILADTDGDGFTDDAELFAMNRNPLIADLPLPQITVQDIALELNITSSYTDEEGMTQSVSDTTSSTFGQSRTDTLGTSDTATTQTENEFGQEVGFEGGYPLSFSVSVSASFSQSTAAGFSSTVDKESAQTASQEYQQSVTNALEKSESRSVTRNIESAIVQATVNIANKSNLAFSITNIELSLLQQDRLTGRTFVPIAALRPTGAADATTQPVYNLGPLDSERGPIIFENTTVFPNRIDALMREPVGLVFEVVNFDVFDEAGRNLVFTSQDVVDRTVGITLDFGDGRVELYRVATAGEFDENGREVGISLQRALEIIGLTKEAPGNTAEKDTYKTMLVSREDEDMNMVQVEVLVRMRDVENSADGLNFWTAITSDDNLTPFINFTEMRMHAHETILLMYTSDEDADRLFLREEYLYGSRDDDTDSDDDMIGDFEEVRTGWTVAKVPGLPYKVFPSPARPDSDLDGLDDKAEKSAGTDPNRADTDEDGRSDTSEVKDTYSIVLFDNNLDVSDDKFLMVIPYSDWAITAGPNGTCNTAVATGDDTLVTQNGTGSKLCIASGPNGVIDTALSGDDKKVATPKIDPGPDGKCQTITASSDDVVEFSDANNPPLKGSIGKVCISAGLNDLLDTAPMAGSDDFIRVAHKGLFGTDPVRQDTDLDGIGDGREAILGINPNTKDAGMVIDTDGDGLFDSEEEQGWAVQGFVGLITSDKSSPDTDRDGIPDIIERAIGTHPNRLDTDGDTLLDYLELDTGNPLVNGVPMFNSVTLATAVQKCNDATHCSYVPPPGSSQTDTNPAKADTDADGRNDNVELNVACTYQVFGGSATQVFSNPRLANEDLDGRTDGQECVAGGTNPKDVDTDDDGRSDGDEATFSLDPLRKDKQITVTLTAIHVDGDCDGSTLRGLELLGAFNFGYPTATGFSDFQFYDAPCQGEQGACDVVNVCCCKSCGDGTACDGEDISVQTSTVAFTFREGDSFTLKTTELKDNDDLGGCNGALKDSIGTMNTSVPFAVALDSAQAIAVGSSGCMVTVNYSITVNH